MDAVEYLRQRARMCEAIRCADCFFFDGDAEGNCMSGETEDPEKSVEIIRKWAEQNPEEPRVVLTAMERRFVHIYIDKGYLWAARDKGGELKIYKRCQIGSKTLLKALPPWYMAAGRSWGICFPALLGRQAPYVCQNCCKSPDEKHAGGEHERRT